MNNESRLPTSDPVPEGYDAAPPPWSLEAEAWWILPPIPMPWQAKTLPPGAIDPLEAETYERLQATYTGGLGAIQIVRYHDSPVGPYDELIYVPGNMTYKPGASTTHSGVSVTRIYVSSIASVVNGRRNWNIPKHLAWFTFTPESDADPFSPTVVSVYPALPRSTTEFGSEPAFSARLVPSRRLPSVPLDLGKIPTALLDPRLVQPPLTHGDTPSLVGTQDWCTVTPGYAGQVRAMYPEPALTHSRFGDGVGFPDVKALSVGLWWPKVKLTFSEPTILEGEDKKTK